MDGAYKGVGKRTFCLIVNEFLMKSMSKPDFLCEGDYIVCQLEGDPTLSS